MLINVKMHEINLINENKFLFPPHIILITDRNKKRAHEKMYTNVCFIGYCFASCHCNGKGH